MLGLDVSWVQTRRESFPCRFTAGWTLPLCYTSSSQLILERTWCPLVKLLTLQVKLGGKKLLLVLYGTLLLLN